MKKYILLVGLIVVFFKSNAQTNFRQDTIYYLVDTLQTPEKDRMWDVFIEGNTKCFIIKCPCLQYNSDPTFTYRITDADYAVSKRQLKSINTTSVTTLIDIAKGNLGKLTTYPLFMFIERTNGIYTMHKVRFRVPMKPREPAIDYMIITDTISKKHK